MNFSKNCHGKHSENLAAPLPFSLTFIHATHIHQTVGITWEERCRDRIIVILNREGRGLASKWHLSKDVKKRRAEPSRYLENEQRERKEQSLEGENGLGTF